MKKRKIRKIYVQNQQLERRQYRVSNDPKKPSPIEDTVFDITESLYRSNEVFSNSIKKRSDKDSFFRSLQLYSIKKFNEAKGKGKPIVNMVFHGHWGWVFSKMIEHYQKYASEYSIIPSVDPIPGANVYQYWRPVSEECKKLHRVIKGNHPYFTKGVHMMHDSPYDPSRSDVEWRTNSLKRYHSALCTSKEQYDYYSNRNVSAKLFHVPLGVNENLKCKETPNLNDKIRIGFIGRLYWDGVKGEDKLLEIAKKISPKNFEFIILSPNAKKEIGELTKLGFTVIVPGKKTFEDLYQMIDVTLILSKHEGTPLPLIESLYVGTYVLSTKVGEAPYILPSENICNTTNSFIKKLNQIQNDRSILSDFIQTGKDIVKYRTWEAFVKKSVKIWKTVS